MSRRLIGVLPAASQIDRTANAASWNQSTAAGGPGGTQVAWTERATGLSTAHPGGTVITGPEPRRWTWAGIRANAALAATLSDLTDGVQRFDDTSIRLGSDITPATWRAGTVDPGAVSACPRSTIGRWRG